MNGKTCLVTGATRGIGLATARALAVRGATVLLHGRDAELGEAVTAALVRETGNTSLRFVRADFMHLEQVRDLAEQLSRLPRIDVLINNAGLMEGARRTRRCTAEGYDATFAVNHLAPFLLTNLLLATLTRSKARVVVVASEAHRRARLDFGDLMNAHVSFMRAYERSKLANLLFVRALARRLAGSGVTVNAAHPGLVASELFRSCPAPLRFVLATVVRPFMRSPARGAGTSVYLATSPELDGETGGYYIDCHRTTPSAAARCDEAAARLWDESVRLTGLKSESNN